MPKLVYLSALKNCEINSKIGLLATETTIKTNIYKNFFEKKYNLITPSRKIQVKHVNKSIKYVKMGKIKEAEKAIKYAVNYLLKMKCKKIILGCTELPIAIFAYKSFQPEQMIKINLISELNAVAD